MGLLTSAVSCDHLSFQTAQSWSGARRHIPAMFSTGILRQEELVLDSSLKYLVRYFRDSRDQREDLVGKSTCCASMGF